VGGLAALETKVASLTAGENTCGHSDDKFNDKLGISTA
jgi:hypothetical protein